MTRPAPGTPEYEEQKAQAQADAALARAALAGSAATAPEILYFLARDPSEDVRAEIARNTRTPHQADLVLARDSSEEVRAVIAGKIARLAPALSGEEHARIRDLVFDILRVLAADQLPRIRAILAEAVKSEASIPPDIIRQLARDAEAIVANPVLEFSPLLSDDDLLLVISEGQAMGRLAAIAKRQGLSTTLTDALAATLDEGAIAALLGNGSAQIREETLDAIVDTAAERPSWHEPLVLRPLLPLRLAERLVKFVATALVDRLMARAEEWAALESDVGTRLKAALNARLQEGAPLPSSAEEGASPLSPKAFPCNDDNVEEACLQDNRSGLIASLAAKTGLSASSIMAILGSGAPRVVTALAWKAGLNMRTALRLQIRMARIPTSKVLNAKDGVDYPLSEKEMTEALALFS